jgi:hypothetical protein
MMGYFANLELEILDMARDLGDAQGQDAETILIISRNLNVAPAEVQRVLGEEADLDEYDGQPDELTEWMDFDPDC